MKKNKIMSYYTLSGALANASTRGIIIGNGKKTIR